MGLFTIDVMLLEGAGITMLKSVFSHEVTSFENSPTIVGELTKKN